MADAVAGRSPGAVARGLSAASWTVRRFADLAGMWVRASMAYRVSFWLLALGTFVIGALDLAGIWVLFQNIDRLGGFSLVEIALLYGATGLALAFADFVVGRVDRLGQLIRLGRLDTMLVRPVPLLVQVCADEFALRRLTRVLMMTLVFAWGATAVTWTPVRVGLAVVMVLCGSLIFFALFVTGACIQFWTADAAEFANAFTYGGNTLTQYPLTVLPRELVLMLTVAVPVAFVNWYPALFLLGRPDPFGLPSWLAFASPLVAGLLLVVAMLTWRTGVRHYRSTGS